MHLFHVRTNLKGVQRPLQPACWIQFAQLPTAILNSRVLPYCVRVDWVHGGWPSVGYGVLLYKTETNLVLLSVFSACSHGKHANKLKITHQKILICPEMDQSSFYCIKNA